jgi:hypothetical protein
MSLAVVICNWNKKEDLLTCLDHVNAQTLLPDEWVVVDNASTDDSVAALRRRWGERVTLLQNGENRGGAGGFNRGLHHVLTQGHDWIHLLDNDAFLAPDCLERSLAELELHPDWAAVGSQLRRFHHPELLQEMGAVLDWERFHVTPLFQGLHEGADLPALQPCDYVPACSVLLRSEAIRSVGLMDEGCFIYWDDMEWFYRMKQKGWQVVAMKSALANHKMGVKQRDTTFGSYYFWRNRVHFFLNHLERPTDRERFFRRLAWELQRAWHMSLIFEDLGVVDSLSHAVLDGFQGIRGQAPPGRLQKRKVHLPQTPPTDRRLTLMVEGNWGDHDGWVQKWQALGQEVSCVALRRGEPLPEGPLVYFGDHVLDGLTLSWPFAGYVDRLGHQLFSRETLALVGDWSATVAPRRAQRAWFEGTPLWAHLRDMETLALHCL